MSAEALQPVPGQCEQPSDRLPRLRTARMVSGAWTCVSGSGEAWLPPCRPAVAPMAVAGVRRVATSSPLPGRPQAKSPLPPSRATALLGLSDGIARNSARPVVVACGPSCGQADEKGVLAVSPRSAYGPPQFNRKMLSQAGSTSVAADSSVITTPAAPSRSPGWSVKIPGRSRLR